MNRCLVSIRRFLDHLVQKGYLQSNPARQVKELRRQQLAPKGLGEMRCGDCCGRSNSVAIFGHRRSSICSSITGARVSDLVNLGNARRDDDGADWFCNLSTGQREQGSFGAVAASCKEGIGGLSRNPTADDHGPRLRR